MFEFLKKPFAYAALFGVLLTSVNSYVLLKTFLIPSVEGYVTQSDDNVSSDASGINDSADSESISPLPSSDDSTARPSGQSNYRGRKRRPGSSQNGDNAGSSRSRRKSQDSSNSGESKASQDSGSSGESAEQNLPSQAVQTANSYNDGKISVNISTVRTNDTTVYIADVQVASAAYLKTALAQNAYGRNVTAKTSVIASQHQAILAINGDYYGANSRGYVIKNGVIYRDTARKDTGYDDLVIYKDGSFGIINESNVTAQELLDSGVTQLFAFGPTLVKNGQVVVSSNDEVGRSMADNPRTAIGIIDDLHYIMVVSDGRTGSSQGLTLYQLAQVMQQYGCTTAYNLDGGGSSTMVFSGQVVNQPTTNGNNISERAVSDIVYIGY